MKWFKMNDEKVELIHKPEKIFENTEILQNGYVLFYQKWKEQIQENDPLFDNIVNVEDESKPPTPLGLKNIGNTCYINSVIQALAFMDPLSNWMSERNFVPNSDIGDDKSESYE